MYLLGVLCLLSAAVALPTPEQLHTNLPALSPPPELKSEEKGKSSEEKATLHLGEPDMEVSEKADESKNLSESEEKSKEEKDEDKKITDDIKEIQKDSKESKEGKDSKEKSKESKESKEESWEHKPKEPEDVKKDKDWKSEESKEKYDEEVPAIVQIIEKPSKGFISDWFSKWFPNIHFPWSFRSELQNGELQDQPIFIVRESDFD